jgi:hypothetical protein
MFEQVRTSRDCFADHFLSEGVWSFEEAVHKEMPRWFI